MVCFNSIKAGLFTLLIPVFFFACSKTGTQFEVFDVAIDADTLFGYVMVDIASGETDALGDVYAPESMERALYKVNLRSGSYEKVHSFDKYYSFASEGGNGWVVLQDRSGKMLLYNNALSEQYNMPDNIKFCRMSAYDTNVFTYLIDSTVYGLDLRTFTVSSLHHFNDNVTYYKWSGEVFYSYYSSYSGYGYSAINTIIESDAEVMRYGHYSDWDNIFSSSFRKMQMSMDASNVIRIVYPDRSEMKITLE